MSSSGRYKGVSYHHENFVIDGDEAGSSFVTEFETFPWFQIDFAVSLDAIAVVEVFKRGGLFERFFDVEVRIGEVRTEVSFGRQRIEFNQFCYNYGDADLVTNPEVMPCASPLRGRYLTLQKLSYGTLSFQEIHVYRTTVG